MVGATSGIGRGLAQLLVKNNYVVGITGRRLELLNTLKSENPDKYIISVFDVTHSDTVAENLNVLVNQLGECALFARFFFLLMDGKQVRSRNFLD